MKSKAAPTRRLGVENSETRAQLVEAAARLISDEGCAAVTARRLAEEVGLKRQIVHYYFGTIEDLLLAVIRRDSERFRDKFVQALQSDEPLKVIWQIGNHATTMLFEFSAMAIRRKTIQVEMKRYMDDFRQLQAQALASHLEQRGIKPVISPIVTAIVINSIAHTLAVEKALKVTEGHVQTKALVEGWLQVFAERGASFTSGAPAKRKRLAHRAAKSGTPEIAHKRARRIRPASA